MKITLTPYSMGSRKPSPALGKVLKMLQLYPPHVTNDVSPSLAITATLRAVYGSKTIFPMYKQVI